MAIKRKYVVRYQTVIQAETYENAQAAAELAFIQEPLIVIDVTWDFQGIQACYLDAEEIIDATLSS